MIDRIILPNGWEKEALDREGKAILLKSPNRGLVTIDPVKRWWNTGAGVSRLKIGEGANAEGKTYSGRGWLEALVRDAVEALRKCEEGIGSPQQRKCPNLIVKYPPIGCNIEKKEGNFFLGTAHTLPDSPKIRIQSSDISDQWQVGDKVIFHAMFDIDKEVFTPISRDEYLFEG
jgi:hypothetical protein